MCQRIGRVFICTSLRSASLGLRRSSSPRARPRHHKSRAGLGPDLTRTRTGRDDVPGLGPDGSKSATYGETRTRTGDTTIFSRVLYQLSYLAARRSVAPGEPL